MSAAIPNRWIKCKECGKLKHSTKFQWVFRFNVYSLNSLQCQNCKSKNYSIARKLRKQNPEPKNSKCECCGRVSKLHCDHSHTKSKNFRGYLCRKCNVGIGNLGDDLNGVINAIKYLSKNLSDNKKTKVIEKLKLKLW